MGDILNTAARLEEYARTQELAFVASASVVDPLELPAGVFAPFECELKLRGKAQGEEVLSLDGIRVPRDDARDS